MNRAFSEHFDFFNLYQEDKTLKNGESEDPLQT